MFGNSNNLVRNNFIIAVGKTLQPINVYERRPEIVKTEGLHGSL